MRITKYHGLGNDFVIVHEREVESRDYQTLAITLCDRHTSVGADGLIIVKENPLEMVYYNSDGSRAKMCGNGIRCFAKYCYDEGIVSSDTFDVITLAGVMKLLRKSEHPFLIEVNMGHPVFTSREIPMNVNQETFVNQTIQIDDNQSIQVTSMLMGATHTTVQVEDISNVDMVSLGCRVQELDIYPDSTNVNFYQVLNNREVRTQTYERGAGLTLACGTGACAVYVALQLEEGMEEEIIMHLPLGDLIIGKNEQNEILMTGPAVKIIDSIMEV